MSLITNQWQENAAIKKIWNTSEYKNKRGLYKSTFLSENDVGNDEKLLKFNLWKFIKWRKAIQ